jgi:hypothetical protein
MRCQAFSVTLRMRVCARLYRRLRMAPRRELAEAYTGSRFRREFPHTETRSLYANAGISRHFEHSPIQYALETGLAWWGGRPRTSALGVVRDRAYRAVAAGTPS